jgi:hypothetical protein
MARTAHYNFRSWTITFVFFNRFENQYMFWKHNFNSYFHLFDDFYFHNGENIHDGVFQIFYAFFQALESIVIL